MRKSRSLCYAGAIAALAAFIVGPSGAHGDPDTAMDGADPNGYAIAQHDHSTVYEPPPGVIGGNPSVEAFDMVDADGLPRRQVMLDWQSNADLAAVDTTAHIVWSYDGGYTFPSAIEPFDRGGGPIVKLRDGSLLEIGFIPAKVVNDHTVQLHRRRSTDGGRTWKEDLATFRNDQVFNPAKFNRGLRVHRDMFYARDGALLMSYYTAYSQDPGFRAELARSTDGGQTWTRYATVAAPTPDGYLYDETGVTRAANGDLIAVSRTSKVAKPGQVAELRTTRSTDDGRTWSAPRKLAITTVSGEPVPTPSGVQPTLRLLPNGIMTLRFGRPDNWIAISPDGLGHSFEQAQTTYVNHPRVNASFQRFHGSSGNGWSAVVGPSRLLITGDNCAPTWGCPETDAGFHTDGEYRVWKKFVDIVGPGLGKIDLLGKYAAGSISIDTNMTDGDKRLPEMSPLGAIDGSTDWASAAVRTKSTGKSTYTMALDHTYTLTRAGLSLRYGAPASATVEVSTDGETWTEVVDTGAINSYALRYYPIDAVRANRVRVTVADADAKGWDFLNELELYSTVDSFENDPVGQPPRGYTGVIGATVTDFDVADSRHVMRLADAWNDKIAQAHWVSAPAPKQTLEFRVNSIGYPRSFGFVTRGDTAAAKGVAAFQMNVGSDGSIGWYDATARRWNKLTEPGTAPQRKWHAIRVEATLDGAEVFLDGKSVGTAPPTTPGVTALTGHSLTSSGTTSTYDHFLIDDVEQTNPT